MIRIYLDWNIIKNLKSQENEDAKLLKIILNKTRSNLLIPYSIAHLNNLMKSYKKGEREKVEEDLYYVSDLTRNVCLNHYWNDEYPKWHKRDPKEFFESLIEDESSNYSSWDELIEELKGEGMNFILESFKSTPHDIDFRGLDEKNPALGLFFNKSRIENSINAIMQDIFDLLQQIRSSPVTYRELRNQFRTMVNIDPNISNFENAIETLDNYLPKTILNKSFTELYDEHHTPISKSKDYDRITGIYMQLDLVGFNPDKINNKNEYENLFNDAMHCYYAAHCDYYITNDNKNIKKSRATYEGEEIRTIVYDLEGFFEELNEKLSD